MERGLRVCVFKREESKVERKRNGEIKIQRKEKEEKIKYILYLITVIAVPFKGFVF